MRFVMTTGVMAVATKVVVPRPAVVAVLVLELVVLVAAGIEATVVAVGVVEALPSSFREQD